jgi:hypothetical protein
MYWMKYRREKQIGFISSSGSKAAIAWWAALNKPTASVNALVTPRKFHPPGGWVERGEQLVGSIDIRFSQAVEQGGFSGVGVTNQGYDRDAGAFALHAVLQASQPHFFNLILEVRDLVADNAGHFNAFHPGAQTTANGTGPRHHHPPAAPVRSTDQSGGRKYSAEPVYLRPSLV